MSVNKLIATLEKEAADREKSLLEEARLEAEGIINDANKHANDIDQQIASICKEVDERRGLIRSGKAVINKRKLSTSIENLYIAVVFNKCRELYRDYMDKKEYSEFVKADLVKMNAEIEKIGEFRADPVTADILKKLKAGGKIVVDKNSDYGFTAVTHGGEINLTNTFGNSLEKLWQEVAPEYVRRIGEATDDEY